MVYFIVFISIFSGSAFGVTLKESLSSASKNPPEIGELSAELASQRASISSMDKAYDTKIYGEANYALDKTEQTNAFSGDKRTQSDFKLGLQKYFSSGTAVDFSVGHKINEIDFPAPSPGSFAASAISPNPSSQSMISLSIKQSLWRNFFAREIELQRLSSLGQVSATENKLNFTKQMVQGETETLYYTLASLIQQIKIMKSIKDLSHRYAKTMSNRLNLGRADSVDVASAQVQAISTEGNLLDMEIQYEELKRKFMSRTSFSGTLQGFEKVSLESNEIPLPVQNIEQAMEYALKNRWDIKALNASMAPLESKEDLAKEKNKPTVDLIAKGSFYGLDEQNSTAWEENLEFEQPQYFVGVQFSWQPGASDYKGSIGSIRAQRQGVEAQRRKILYDLKRDLQLAFYKLAASSKKLIQAKRHVSSLRAKERAEARKFKQARSEKIITMLYELERKNAEMTVLSSLLSARTAEAGIRMQIHGYATQP